MEQSVRIHETIPLVTVAIPVLNEERYIESCLASVFMGHYPAEQLEVLVIDGGSTDRTVEIVQGFAESHVQVRLVSNPDRIQAVAMNIAIDQAAGDMIVRLDAHARYRPQHISRIVEKLLSGAAENVGGVQHPVGDTRFSRLAAICLRSKFSMGGSAHRMAVNPSYAESVFLGGWKTETLRKLGGFDPEWKINEDYELNVRLRGSGGRVMVLPELQCEYSVRPSLNALTKQYFRYGFWRSRTFLRHRNSLRLRHTVPLILVVALILSFIALAAGITYGLVVPVIYGLALLGVGTNLTLTERRMSGVLSPMVFGLIHLAFGFGLAVGMLRWSLKS